MQTQSGSALKSTVTQGTGSNATINTFNESTTNQTGRFHSATVTQDGNANKNKATITQTGNEPGTTDGNTATVSQQTNSLQNEAMIRQINGNNSSSAIEQNSTSSLNKASINQSGIGSGASIKQNDTSVENQARVVQTGNANQGTIEQKNNSGGTGIGNVADLVQLGSNNAQTSIIQNAISYNNKAYLNQYGNNNQETRITQSNTSYNNQARIDQGGDGKGQFPADRPGDIYGSYIPVNNGTAIIEQSNNSHDNEARIGQSGNGHNAQIYQNGTVSSSKAFIDQFPASSGNNTGLIKQTNSTLSSARITQNQNSYPGAAGTGNNIAEVYQGNTGMSLSSGNMTTVVQENGNNKSYNEQFGTDNLMDIKQFGDGNVVTGPAGVFRAAGIAHQEGTGNKAYITQTASGGVANVASLIQNGTGNMATITQTGGVTN